MEKQNDSKSPLQSGSFEAKSKSIFNPYNQSSNDSALIPISEEKEIIPNLLIRSDGCFGDNWGSPTTDSIHVYEITADVAALQVQISAYSTAKGNFFALGFFDKSLKEIYLDKNEKSRASMAYRTSYLMWHFGSILRKDMPERKDWIVVPREIFKSIDDFVYLCICTEESQEQLKVKSASFPKDRPFFYDLPVATSIYKGQPLRDSRIKLGRVMEYKNGKYTPLIGEYLWNNVKVVGAAKNDPTVEFVGATKKTPTVEIQKRSDYIFQCSENKAMYSCPEIELYIYTQKPEERAKDVTAFVWQSGNEDDEVKKAYLKEGKDNPYNTYSHVMDCLSTHTMYKSMVSLTKFTAENAARYAVRTLAKQPDRFRCFSIDCNNLVFLMGGAIYKIEFIISHAVGKDENNKTILRNLNDDEISIVKDLYAVNGSHLFFDTDVTYEHAVQENVRYYMQDVLGIEKGSNGCKKIQKLLTDLFAHIAKLGVGLDYVYCDIEGPWNDARPLLSRRFSERYFIKNTNCTSFYNSTLLKELMGRKEIWDEMRKRGLDFSTNQLSDVCAANDNPTSYMSFYGLNPMTYPIRRNPNIWDAVMKGYENEMFYTYVMTPVLKYSPRAKCSVFEHGHAKGYVNHAQRFETYLGGNVLQNPDIYSCGAIYGETSGEYYKKLCMDNWKMFPNKRNFFSYFVGNVNKLRSLLVSTQSEKQKNGKFNAFFSSFNIWVNGYLQGGIEGEIEQLVKQLKNGNDKTIHSLEAYYNEFMYHVFLCCPDKAIAYFQVEKNDIKSNGTTDEGGTYYFPYGNVNDITSYERYYGDCYRRLQNVLVELNNKIRKSEYETLVNSLASENEPYVISGIQLKDKNLWRVTLNEPITTTTISNNIDIKLSNGRTISFPKASNVIKGEYGLWIETPLGCEPKFTAESKYYENNPAYSSLIDYAGLKNKQITNDYFKNNRGTTLKLEEFANVDKVLRFIHLDTHTLFGETPNFITSSILFALKKGEENSTDNHTGNNGEKLLENYVLLFFDGNELYFPAIRKLDNPANSYDFSTWHKEGKKSVFRKKIQLTKGDSYELIKYVAFSTEACAEIRTGRIRYELWELEQNKPKSLVFEDEKDIVIANPNQMQSNQSFIEIASLDPQFNWDDITVQQFKMYFTQQYEKLELFRESDGVSIGRVNKQVNAFANLPVETKWRDTLLGKLSWLNATDNPVEYAITFNMFNSSQGLINQQKSTVKVEANSEGNVIIPLPPLNKSTCRVELTFEKPEKTQTEAGTTFFTDHYNTNRKQTISVDISN